MLRNWKPKHKPGKGKLKANYWKRTISQTQQGLSSTHTANRRDAGIKTVHFRDAGNDRLQRLEGKLMFC